MGKRAKWPEWLSGIEHAKKRAFLVAYSESGNVSGSCAQVGIERATEWYWRSDAAFVAAKAYAWQLAAEKLEAEAFRRAHDGVEEPVFQGGAEVGRVRKYSDTLLIFLLKGAKPNTYRDQWKGEISGPDGGPIRTALDLSKLTEEELATLERIAARAAEPDAPRG
jgi:hypothetical protein